MPCERTSPRAEDHDKKLRGSKLDATVDDEYKAAVAAADSWDSSGWAAWIVTGRVLPERCDVKIAPVQSQGISAMGRFKLDLEVTRSLVSAACVFEKETASVFEIADTVRTALAFPVDYIAFQNRGAYEVVLDLCINKSTGQAFPIPIFEPIFGGSSIGLSFNANADKSNLDIPWEAAADPGLPTALHDLSSAIRYPRRTFEYCRMAVEIVRAHFDPPSIRKYAEKSRAGEEAMCAALHLTRKSLASLDAVAARSRHGQLVVSMDWDLRRRALEFSWEVVARFTDYLGSAPRKDWILLDVRLEE